MFGQKKRFVLFGLIFCVCLVILSLLRGQTKSFAISQPPKKVVTLTLVGHFDGMIQSVAITNTTAYLGDDHSLVVLDVSDPANPTEIIRASEIVTDTISAIDMDGNYVYLAAGLAGMAIVDFSSPLSPEIVGQLYGLYPTERIINLVVVTDTVYLSETDYSYGGRDGRIMVDVATPSYPQEISFYSIPENYSWPSLLAVKGSYLLTSTGWFELDVIDFAIPSSPVLASNIYSSGLPEDLAIKDNFLFVANEPELTRAGPIGGGLYIYDISDITVPQKLLEYSYNARNVFLTVYENYVFYFGWLQGMRMVIWDVQDPSHPQRMSQDNLSEIQSWPPCYDMKVLGNYIYLACSEQGLFIYRWEVVELTETFFLPVITHQTEGD